MRCNVNEGPGRTCRWLVLGAAVWLTSLAMIAQTPSGSASASTSQGATETSATVQMTMPLTLAYRQGKHAFNLKGTAVAIAQQVLEGYGVQAFAAEDRGGAMIHFETEEVDYEQAKELMQLATGFLVIPMDSTHVLVTRDTKQNRQNLLREETEVLHLPTLSAADLADVTNIAKSIFDAPKVAADPSAMTVTIEAPESRLLAFNVTMEQLFQGANQILVDLSLSEFDRSRSVNIGLQLPQSSTVFNVDSEIDSAIASNSSAVSAIISSGLASPTDYAAIAAILVEEGLVSGVLSEPFALFGGGLTETGLTFGTLAANLALNSSESRTLNHAFIRVRENEPATLKLGTRYPVETAQYTGAYYSSAGKVVSSTTPEVQYEDLGFEVKVTSHVQGDNRVQLAIEMKLEGLSGSSINSIPVLSSRILKTMLSVPENRRAMFASALTRQESGSLDQLPGAGEWTNNSTDDDEAELVLLVTPYIAHKAHEESSGRLVLLPVHD